MSLLFSLFLRRLDQGLVDNAESTHVNRVKGKAMLVPKVGRYCKFLKSNNEKLTICDKYAQPVELGENWRNGASTWLQRSSGVQAALSDMEWPHWVNMEVLSLWARPHWAHATCMGGKKRGKKETSFFEVCFFRGLPIREVREEERTRFRKCVFFRGLPIEETSLRISAFIFVERFFLVKQC